MILIFFRNSKGNAFCKVTAEDAFNAEGAFHALCKVYRNVIMQREDGTIYKEYNSDF